MALAERNAGNIADSVKGNESPLDHRSLTIPGRPEIIFHDARTTRRTPIPAIAVGRFSAVDYSVELPEHEDPFASLSGYNIVSEHPEDREYNNRNYKGTRFLTEDGMNFFLVGPKSKVRLYSTPFQLNGAREAIWGRQDPELVKELKSTKQFSESVLPLNIPTEHSIFSRTPAVHGRVIKFLLKNWPRTVREFYGKPPEDIPGDLFRAGEVNLEDYEVVYAQERVQVKNGKLSTRLYTCGQSDVTGVGPDGQIFPIEVGRNNQPKHKQLSEHMLGIKAILRDTNHGEPEPPVHGRIAEYDLQDNVMLIFLKAPPVRVELL